MLKLCAGYSKKVPVPGQAFSSPGYHAAVELELSDALQPEEVLERMSQTFALVRQAVEHELNGQPAAQPAAPPAAPAAAVLSGRPAAKASTKQLRFILDLADRQHLSLSQLNAEVQKYCGGADLYARDRKQASALMDELKWREAAYPQALDEVVHGGPCTQRCSFGEHYAGIIHPRALQLCAPQPVTQQLFLAVRLPAALPAGALSR